MRFAGAIFLGAFVSALAAPASAADPGKAAGTVTIDGATTAMTLAVSSEAENLFDDKKKDTIVTIADASRWAGGDRGARRARVDAGVGAMQPLEIAREVRSPREPQVRERHGLRMLAEAVAGQDRVGMSAGEIDQRAP